MNVQAEMVILVEITAHMATASQNQKRVVATMQKYVDFMRQQKKTPRAVTVGREQYSELVTMVNKMRQPDQKAEALAYQGIPVERV